MIWSALLHFFGVEPRTPSTAYNAWSGILSDVSEFAIIGFLIDHVRRMNCQVTGCYRIGHFPVDGTPFKVCRAHHPQVPTDGPITVEHIAAAGRGTAE